MVDRERLNKETQAQQKQIEGLQGEKDMLSTGIETLRSEKAGLETYTANIGLELRQAQGRVTQLTDLVNDLIKTNETISNNSMNENARLARDLKQNELLQQLVTVF